MDEHQLPGNELPFQLKVNLDRFLVLPAVYSPEMTAEDWQAEIKRMFSASLLTRSFVDGQISPDDYDDGLADLDYDPHYLGELWEEGISLGG